MALRKGGGQPRTSTLAAAFFFSLRFTFSPGEKKEAASGTVLAVQDMQGWSLTFAALSFPGLTVVAVIFGCLGGIKVAISILFAALFFLLTVVAGLHIVSGSCCHWCGCRG
jgi:hypothetical protein